MHGANLNRDPFLAGLRWHRVRGALRNTRDDAARAHPWWILHSTLKHGVPDDSHGREVPFTFRLLADAGERIAREQIYPFEIFFPGDDLSPGREFTRRLTYIDPCLILHCLYIVYKTE